MVADGGCVQEILGEETGLAHQFNCSECGGQITVMCFIGTGVCCELCRKKRDGA